MVVFDSGCKYNTLKLKKQEKPCNFYFFLLKAARFDCREKCVYLHRFL